jgi:hypothetical protein
MVAESILRCTRRYLNPTLRPRVQEPGSVCGFQNASLTSTGARSVFAVLKSREETEPSSASRCRSDKRSNFFWRSGNRMPASVPSPGSSASLPGIRGRIHRHSTLWIEASHTSARPSFGSWRYLEHPSPAQCLARHPVSGFRLDRSVLESLAIP